MLQTILSMQAREKVTATKQHLQKQEGMVTTAASRLPRYKRTKVSHEFVRQPNWQAHLYRISPYLVCGEGVWWKNEQDCYTFLNSINDPSQNVHGPTLTHFRKHSLRDVETR